ncbi:MAG: cell division protein FtsZ [Fibrobacteraceae bacterium]|nr:cell division protein FtsZ [Fibrobacteraceae bacterium]
MSEFENIDIETVSHIVADDSSNDAKVKVFGVGGAGGNTVNRMVKMNIKGVEYYAVNTDAKALELSLADHKIPIGQKVTKNLGAGMKPEKGKEAAEENVEDLKEAMRGADLIFVTAGMGGGTGTGAAPIVGSVARDLGILTVGVVTKPFGFEGKRRTELALEGIKNLRGSVDTIIVVDNQKLLNVVQSTDKTLTLDGAFRLTDEILGNAVRSICDIMFRHGLIHVDFNDIHTVMQNGGSALMGTGIAEGEGRGIKATDIALSSPLLEDINVDGATGVLVNVSHGENFSLLELNEAMEHIHDAVSDKNNPNIIFGDIIVPELGDKVCITIIATGCGGTTAYNSTKPMFASNTFTAPTPRPVPSVPEKSISSSVGAPTMNQPTVASKPVEATPRPTATNFFQLAQGSVAAPKAESPAEVLESSKLPFSTTVVPAVIRADAETSFGHPGFNAKNAAVEEEIVVATQTAVATAPTAAVRHTPQTEEFSGVADEDIYNQPAYMRKGISEPTVKPSVSMMPQATMQSQQPEDSIKQKGIDYDMPAFLRANMNSGDF